MTFLCEVNTLLCTCAWVFQDRWELEPRDSGGVAAEGHVGERSTNAGRGGRGAGLWAWSLAGRTSPRFLETSPVPAAPTRPVLRPLALEGQQAELGCEGRAAFGPVLSKPSGGARLPPLGRGAPGFHGLRRSPGSCLSPRLVPGGEGVSSVAHLSSSAHHLAVTRRQIRPLRGQWLTQSREPCAIVTERRWML